MALGKKGDLSDFDNVPFHRYLGITVADQSADHVRLRLTVGETTPTGIDGSVNGGALATLVDMAAVAAVVSGLREGTALGGTADLQVSYLRQAKGAWLDASAQVLRRGRNLCVVEVSVRNDAGVLCSKGRVLYALRTVDSARAQ